ncbi:MAG: glycosyltransferase [Promethearchaeota archaeon]
MKSKKYDLAVAYRIYPLISGEPPVYRESKYKLAKLCLESFKECLDDINIKIWAIMDNCPKNYENLFRMFFKNEDLKIIHLNNFGNQGTFNLQIKILSEQKDSELVYFAEDDYYYLPSQFKKMITFLKNNDDVDFVTPYDHLDHYSFPFHNYKSKIKVYANKHWRTINSTCCTFLTSRKILRKTKKVFQIYKNNTILLSSWVCLTKYKVFNPFFISKYLSFRKDISYYYYKAWRYGWRQILFGRKWNLWCPIPTIATHMDKNYLSPTIDWKKIFLQKKEND